jgi:type I restriction enzyme, S subunit
MKKPWERAPLDEAVFLQEGPGIRSYEYQKGGYPMINVRCVQDGYIDLSTCNAASVELATGKWKHFQVKEGDILFTISGSIGRTAIVKKEDLPLLMNTSVVRFRSKTTRLRDDFFFYYLQSWDFLAKLHALSSGTAQKNVGPTHLKTMDVPLPPLPEQQRVVSLLDEAFAGIATAKANAEKNLQNGRALFESHIQSVFTQRGNGLKEKKLNELCAITSTLVDPRRKAFLDLIHVGAANIESQTGALVELRTAREEGLISGKFLFDPSMVLYSKIRPYLMKVARPDFAGLCSADMYPLAPLPGQITRDYLFYLLLSKRFTDFAIQGSARAGMPKVNREHLFEFKTWLPDVSLQKKQASQLDELHVETQRLANIYERKLAALEALKKSLLHQAFTGDLSKGSTHSVVAPFPVKIPNISTTDMHAGVLALSYQAHRDKNRLASFAHVKAEKIAHMVESFVGIDLGRSPVKDTAGPNDFPHLTRVEYRAKMAGYFDFQRTDGGAYRVKTLRRFDKLLADTRMRLGGRLTEVEVLFDLMVPMNTQQAEIVATVFAAWNNLLLENRMPTDDEIVIEARENWHPAKLNISRERFVAAIQWLREKNVIPKGQGKKVLAKSRK